MTKTPDIPLNPARPLSPHLGVYRWQLHMILSILHRATGVALSAGAPLLVLWLWTAAYSPECFAAITGFLKSPFGLVLLFCWSFAFYLHLCNGVRHLFWDIGKGFEIHTVTKTGVLVVIAAIFFTVCTWMTVFPADSGSGERSPTQSMNPEPAGGKS
jgi:succinate dehydrogenase / fumarate reductase cytochrome b subunit